MKNLKDLQESILSRNTPNRSSSMNESTFPNKRRDRKNYTVEDELIDMKNILKPGLAKASSFKYDQYDGKITLLDIEGNEMQGYGSQYYVAVKSHSDEVISTLERKYNISNIS